MTGYRKPADGHATAGARRLLALAEQGTRIDKRLWTEIAKLTGANSNTTALVGTPEQVAGCSATITNSASAISSFAASIL